MSTQPLSVALAGTRVVSLAINLPGLTSTGWI